MSGKENDKTTVIEENSIKRDKPARKKNSDRNGKTTAPKKRAASPNINKKSSTRKKAGGAAKANTAARTTTNKRRRKKLAEHWYNVATLLVLYDLAVVNFSYISALWLNLLCILPLCVLEDQAL